MNARILAVLLPAILVFLSDRDADAAAASWRQDDLIRKSDVIAIVDVYERVFPNINGTIANPDGSEFSTALILYASRVREILLGRIPKEPFIIQFAGAADRDPIEPGRYILFLMAEGHMFMPLESKFRIKDDKVLWYKRPFLRGSDGPEFGEIPLSEGIRDIKRLIEKYKKS